MERVGRRQDSTGARLPTTHFILLSFELDELIQKTQNKNKKQNLKQYPCSFMSIASYILQNESLSDELMLRA